MANANNNIDIHEDSVQILVDCIKEHNITKQLSSSISMVPSMLRDVTPSCFNPQMVSIGPLHHGDENLREGEGFKKSYVRNLLVGLHLSIVQTLEDCLRKVNESIDKIRGCYVGMRPYRDPELARIMVMDGCFILGFLFSPNIARSMLRKNTICIDLLLAENQIPFFVMNDIFEVTIMKSVPTASLITDFMIKFCQCSIIFEGDIANPNVLAQSTHYDHILDLLHKYYEPAFPVSLGILPTKIYNVVELEKAGVRFKPSQNASWIMAMNIEWLKFTRFSWFWAKPTLKMPILRLYDETEIFLRNIIAYEQTSEVVKYFTSYATSMDDLVDSHHDIAKLVESEVILNKLGSNEEAASMFNNICKNVPEYNYYSEQWQQLETYYNSYRPRHIAWLRRTFSIIHGTSLLYLVE